MVEKEFVLGDPEPQQCTRCERPSLNVFEPENEEEAKFYIHPEGGLHLQMYAGYGMFIDLPEYATHQQVIHIRLCHDCVVAILAGFPQRFRNEFAVSHSETTCLATSPTAKKTNRGCPYSY